MKHAFSHFFLLGMTTGMVATLALLVGPTGLSDWSIVLQVRLPRVVLAVLIGFGLAGSGAVFQGLLRNPLADPFILGTSSAATAGVMVANIIGLRNYYALHATALGFALMSIAIVYRISRADGKIPIQTVVLSGVIVSLFFNSLVFIFFSLFYRESFTVLFFLLGTLTEGSTAVIAVSGAIILLGVATTWLLSRELNALTQGEEMAFHLGVEVDAVKKILFVTASATVAASVVVAGMIGFVGLIVPHIMRMIVGSDHRLLLPASALGGAIFLIIADALARTMASSEIPVGAITALIGTPYFVYLLRKKRHAGEF